MHDETPDGVKVPATLAVILERHRHHVDTRGVARKEPDRVPDTNPVRVEPVVKARSPRPVEPEPVSEPVRQTERPPAPAPNVESGAAIASAAADRIAISVQEHEHGRVAGVLSVSQVVGNRLAAASVGSLAAASRFDGRMADDSTKTSLSRTSRIDVLVLPRHTADTLPLRPSGDTR